MSAPIVLPRWYRAQRRSLHAIIGKGGGHHGGGHHGGHGGHHHHGGGGWWRGRNGGWWGQPWYAWTDAYGYPYGYVQQPNLDAQIRAVLQAIANALNVGDHAAVQELRVRYLELLALRGL